eukprot:2393661-Pyramimonas_sp.AAC.1
MVIVCLWDSSATAEPTYYGPGGHISTVDHRLIPESLMAGVTLLLSIGQAASPSHDYFGSPAGPRTY